MQSGRRVRISDPPLTASAVERYLRKRCAEEAFVSIPPLLRIFGGFLAGQKMPNVRNRLHDLRLGKELEVGKQVLD